MTVERSLFAPLTEPEEQQVFPPISGELFVVIFTDGKDTHLHSCHLRKEQAIQTAEDQASHMRRWRAKFWNPKAQPPEAYLVIPVTALHIAKV